MINEYPVRQPDESAESYMERLQKRGFTIGSEPTKSYHYPKQDSDAQKLATIVHSAGKESLEIAPLNPEEIAEYIHTEHTPYSQMSLEDGKKHLAELIERYATWYHNLYRAGSGGLLVKPEDWPKNYNPNKEQLEKL